ncbi:MAG: glycosyltransferase family 2 protein [Defluviimonas sp.]|nr:glycosyltransferase family 2 protein [Defluviimonas sp.]
MTAGKAASVAAILTCYNEGLYIGEAVRSVLDQTASSAIGLIIIADDGSEESTLAVLHDVETWDPRIRVLYGPGGARQAAQRNLAVQSTDLPFIAFLDGDDIWLPGKIEAQLKSVSQDPSIGLVYTAFAPFADGNRDSARPANLIDITDQEDLALAYFLNDPPIMPSTVLMRRDLYVGSGGMDQTIHCFEETEFYLRIAQSTRFACLPAPMVLKRNRSASVTGGRKDLLAFHAFVALKAAADNPSLMPKVTDRLAERARKLANQYVLTGNVKQARAVSAFAVRLAPLRRATWASWAFARLPARLLDHLLRTAFLQRVNTMPKESTG